MSLFLRFSLSALAFGKLAVAMLLCACAQTTVTPVPAALGQEIAWQRVEALLAEAGPIEFERIHAADWAIDRGGLVNLEHESALQAGLQEGLEPIAIYMYAIKHPEHGLFLVDTGVDRATAERDEDAMAAGWTVRQAMNLDALEVRVTTEDWLAAQQEQLAGVFLTHLHLDHILGVPAVPPSVPIYLGPGEAAQSAFVQVFTQATTDAAIGEHSLRELTLHRSPGSPFSGVVDVFGDGSFLAIHIPGHTAGSLAYLVRTTEGPVLLTGDGCHTAWGWNHDVEPGTFNASPEQAKGSFGALRAFARNRPELRVYLGHQDLDTAP